MDIRKILTNPDNIYLGHGTGRVANVVDSIMNNGVRCSHHRLYYTTVPLGLGNQIDDSINYKIRHWEHLDSKEIVILSMPKKYYMPIHKLHMDGYEPFYYTPTEEQIKNNEQIMENEYLMPEFVLGYYDVNKDSFIYNDNYYENLPEKEQEELFNKIKENYLGYVNDYYGIDNYIEIMKDNNLAFPLTNEEVVKFKRKNVFNEIISTIDQGLLNSSITLKDGSTILFNDYLNKYFLPVLPLKNYIVLNNGVNFPITHFIIESIYYDCIKNYDTDVIRYLNEKTNLEETNKLDDFENEANLQL